MSIELLILIKIRFLIKYSHSSVFLLFLFFCDFLFNFCFYFVKLIDDIFKISVSFLIKILFSCSRVLFLKKNLFRIFLLYFFNCWMNRPIFIGHFFYFFDWLRCNRALQWNLLFFIIPLSNLRCIEDPIWYQTLLLFIFN